MPQFQSEPMLKTAQVAELLGRSEQMINTYRRAAEVYARSNGVDFDTSKGYGRREIELIIEVAIEYCANNISMKRLIN